jgi:membrane protein implicated in regulation of membrane protease activity
MAILEWQNLIFVLPMLAAILYILLMTVGFFWGGGGDLDAGHDLHVDVGHDVSGDAGHDVGSAGHGVEGGHGGQGSPVSLLGRAFGLLGIGKVPMSILGLSICLIWGAAGLVLNVFLGMETMRQNILFAALAAVVGARGVAEGLALLLPREESYHTPKAELVGQVGEVLYEVTRTSGTVRMRDPSGNLLDIDCRVQDGAGLKAGTTVVLQEYEPSADVFFVRG